jgi:DNA-binding CsgD family transcriptional regulator/tetratricopeptide (TPR) repeat protein
MAADKPGGRGSHTLSPPAHSGAGTALHGRDREVARLRALIEAAREGSGGVLVLEGEPGSGKTALLDATALTAEAGGVAVLRANGLDSGAELAFSGLTELLRPVAEFAKGLPDDQRRELSAALAPSSRSPQGKSAASPGQLLLGTAALRLLGLAATDRPLLLVVDNLHWIDGSSLAVLGFIGRRISGTRIAMAVSRRTSDPAFGPPATPVMRLAGLDEAAARSLLRELGVDGERRLRLERRGALRLGADEFERLLAETRGNPLALREMVRLAATGALDLATLAGGREPLPAGVQVTGLYHDQVMALPEETRRALLVVAASFTGDAGPVNAALVADGLNASDLGPAEYQGLVELSGGLVQFHHALVRSAVYHGASDEAVRNAHRLLAEALAASEGGPSNREQHAWHRSYAVEGEDADAARELAGVARAAARRGALTAARQAYQRAAIIAPDPAHYLVEAAICARIEGDADEAVALLDEAEEVAAEGDGAVPDGATAPIAARIQAERARVELSRAEPGHLMAELATAAAQATDERQAASLSIAAATAGTLGAHYREAREIAFLALRHVENTENVENVENTGHAEYIDGSEGAESTDDGAHAEHSQPATRAAASALAGHVSLLLGDPVTARELTDAAIALVDPSDVSVPIEAIVFAAWTLTLLHDWSAQTQRVLETAIRVARDAGALSRVPPLLAVSAELNQRAGHWDVAYAHALECARLGTELGQVISPGLGMAVAARIAAYRGVAPDPVSGGSSDHAPTGVSDGDSGSAGGGSGPGPVSGQAIELPALRDDHPVRLALRHAEAIALAETDPAEAQRILTEIAEALDRLGVVLEDFIPIRADLAELTRSEHKPSPDPFDRARAALVEGVALRERRRHAEARAVLEPAREEFRRLGAQRWLKACQAELARTSGDATRVPPPETARSQLTQYETQVALRVGAGATNNETAAALFISPKTVEYHLRNLYRKLGIRSRTELARIVAGWDHET